VVLLVLVLVLVQLLDDRLVAHYSRR